MSFLMRIFNVFILVCIFAGGQPAWSACVTAISPAEVSISASAYSGVVAVSASSSCHWKFSAPTSWITTDSCP